MSTAQPLCKRTFAANVIAVTALLIAAAFILLKNGVSYSVLTTIEPFPALIIGSMSMFIAGALLASKHKIIGIVILIAAIYVFSNFAYKAEAIKNSASLKNGTQFQSVNNG